MIDDVINLMIENDQLSSEELEKINSTLNTKKSKTLTLEEELKKELGEDYEDIINNIDIDIDNTDIKLVDKNTHKKSFIKVTSMVEDDNDIKPKKKITIKTEKNNDKEDNKKSGIVSDDIKNKYKNR
jgi:hypothetical protein